MPDKIPPVSGLALAYARMALGLKQYEAADLLGMTGPALSQIEGSKGLPFDRLEDYVRRLGSREDAVEIAYGAARRLRPVEEDEAETEETALPGPPRRARPGERRAVERAVARGGRAGEEATRAEVVAHLQAEEWDKDRQEAEERCRVLYRLPPEDREILIDELPEFQTWAVAERLAHDSARAAAHKAKPALELAELALRVARKTPGSAAWRACVESECWAFLGNARRVSDDHDGADRAFAEAWRLEEVGAAAGPGPLDFTRRLDLEASLRRDQRHFDEALGLLDEALARARDDKMTAHVLLKRSATLEQAGDAEGALAALQEAAPHVDGDAEPRQLCVLRFNEASILCDLGHFTEAAPLVPKVRDLAVRLANQGDLDKVLWLEAKTDAGLGRMDKALRAYEQVRRALADHENAYDYALATLEEAALLARGSHTAEVRTLAEEALPIFVVKRIHREGLATLRLFVQAAQSEALTAESVRQLIADLKKNRPVA